MAGLERAGRFLCRRRPVWARMTVAAALAVAVLPAVSGASHPPATHFEATPEPPRVTVQAVTPAPGDSLKPSGALQEALQPATAVEPDTAPIFAVARRAISIFVSLRTTVVPHLVAEHDQATQEEDAPRQEQPSQPKPVEETRVATPPPPQPAPAAASAATPTPTPTAPPAPSPTPTPTPTAAPTGTSSPVASAGALNARAAGLYQAMNAERSGGGLPALRLNDGLSAIAEARARDMHEHSYFAHVSPTGESWLTLLNQSGLRAGSGGENLARLSGDVQRSVSIAIEKLMESPTHRSNIMHTRYTDVGVAAITDADGITIFVTVFTGP